VRCGRLWKETRNSPGVRGQIGGPRKSAFIVSVIHRCPSKSTIKDCYLTTRAIARYPLWKQATKRSKVELSHPQRLRLPRIESFMLVFCCKILKASLRNTEEISGPVPLRIRLASSVKVTSSTWYWLSSHPQCCRIRLLMSRTLHGRLVMKVSEDSSSTPLISRDR
jgi:hypothetical protein